MSTPVRCKHCGKRVYMSYRVVQRVVQRLENQTRQSVRAYYHPEGGGWCLTHLEQDEYQRERARRKP